MENCINLHKSRIKLIDTKINFNCVILFIILAFNLDFFYLVDSTVINLNDINLILIFTWVLFSLIENRFKMDKKILKITIALFCLYGILVLTSSFQSHKLYGQPYSYGIRAQRNLIIFPLLFLPIANAYKSGKIELSQLKKVLFLVCTIEMIVGYLQFVLQNQVVFVHLYVSERYDAQRFGFGTTLLGLVMQASLSDAIKGKNKLKNYIFVIAAILFPVLVIRWRMVILQFLLSALVSFFIFQKLSTKKLLLGLIVIGVFMLFLGSTVGQDMIGLLKGTNTNDTDSIRRLGREFYFETLQKYPLFGGGFINTLWLPAYVGAKFDQGIFVVDNGAFGFSFVYGGVGLFLIFIMYIFLIKYSNKIYRKTRNQTYICYLVFTLCGFVTVTPLGMSSSIVLPILILLLYMENESIKKRLI